MLSEKRHHAPRQMPNEISRVNDILDWARRHDTSMLFKVLCTVLRLMEFVYVPAAHVAVKLTEEVARVRFNPGPPAANTRGVTPRKDQAQAVGKGKSKHMDKGKGKMIKPEKPKKVALFPYKQVGFSRFTTRTLFPQRLQLPNLYKRRKTRPRLLLVWPEFSS